MPFLLIQSSGQPSYRMPLRDGKISVGRSQANDICLADDPAVSRFHAEVDCRGDACSVNDLGSHNGTFVDGDPVHGATPLRLGSRVRIGRTVIELSDETMPAHLGSPQDTADAMELNTYMVSVADVMQSIHASTAGPALAEHGDLTAQARAFGALSRAAGELLSHRPSSEVAELVMQMVFETVRPERGAIMLLEGTPPELRPACLRGMEAGDGQALPISRTIVTQVLRDQQSVLTSDAQVDQRFISSESIGFQSVRSAMCVPLWNNQNVTGLIYVDTTREASQFGRVDLEALTLLANLAAVKLDHVRLFERDLQMREIERELQAAARIQARLLPAEAPRIPGYSIFGKNLPCHAVGGDYFDFVRRDDKGLTLVLGDAAGKGMGAALLMATAQAAFRAHASTPAPATEVVGRLNDAVYEQSDADKFFTLFYAELEPQSGRLLYVNAGHNPPLLLRSDHAPAEQLRTGGLILGFRPGLDFASRELVLQPGDLIAIFSDGISEAPAPDGEEFGEDRLVDVLREHRHRSAREIWEQVHQAVLRFTENAPAFDDITLTLVRRD